MLGIASRYFAGRIALAAAAAVFIGLATGADGEGHIAFYATIVFGGAAAAFALLSALTLTVGDGDSADANSAASQPIQPAYWPLVAALGMGLVMIGVVIDAIFTIGGLVLMTIAAIEWTMCAWAERLGGTPEENEAERRRLLKPFEIALFGAAGIAVPVALFSRVLLAVERNAASYVTIIVSAVILLFAFMLYLLPQMRRAIVASTLFVACVALIAAGITAAAIGERDFHHHDDSETHDETGSSASGAGSGEGSGSGSGGGGGSHE